MKNTSIKWLSVLLALLVIGTALPTAFADEQDTTEVVEDTENTEVEAPEADEVETDLDEGTEPLDADEVVTDLDEDTEAVEANEVSDTADITEEEDKVLSSFSDKIRAKIKLLKLERSITKNILRGSVIIEAIEEKDPSFDLTELNAQLDILESSLADLQALSVDDPQREIAQTFLLVHRDALQATKTGRDIARGVLDEADRDAVRTKIRASEEAGEWDVIKSLNDEIHKFLRIHNAKWVAHILDNLGVDAPELIEEIENGDITLGDAKKRLRELGQSMDKEGREIARKKLRESRAKLRVTHEAAKEHINKDHKSAVKKRRTKHKAILDKKVQDVRHVKDRLTNLRDKHKKRAVERDSELTRLDGDHKKARLQRLEREVTDLSPKERRSHDDKLKRLRLASAKEDEREKDGKVDRLRRANDERVNGDGENRDKDHQGAAARLRAADELRNEEGGE